MTRIDLEAILATLVRHGVDFVLVGGLAAAAHGGRRMSLDVDVIVGMAPENMDRLAEAVEDLGFGEVVDEHFRDLDPTDPFDLARAGNLRIETGKGRLDILKRAKGMVDYEDLREHAVEATVGDVALRVAARDHLIAMKLASGRPKDLQDVADLTADETA
jgi:hypothetical protein